MGVQGILNVKEYSGFNMLDISSNEKLALIVSALSFAMLSVYRIYGLLQPEIKKAHSYGQKDVDGRSCDYSVYDVWAIVLCILLFAVIGSPLLIYISKITNEIYSDSLIETVSLLLCICILLLTFMMLGLIFSVPTLHFLVGIIERYHKQSKPGADQEHSESNQHRFDEVNKDVKKNKNTSNNQEKRE